MSPAFRKTTVREFFTPSTRNLLAAELKRAATPEGKARAPIQKEIDECYRIRTALRKRQQQLRGYW